MRYVGQGACRFHYCLIVAVFVGLRMAGRVGGLKSGAANFCAAQRQVFLVSTHAAPIKDTAVLPNAMPDSRVFPVVRCVLRWKNYSNALANSQ